MSDREDEHLSEEEAVRLWSRAAELQAEAARRAESAASAERIATDDTEARTGYALTHVRGAAIEAGIPEEFVDAALADLRAERSVPPSKGVLARSILGDPPAAVVVRRIVEAPPEEVLDAMEAILPADPYRLRLVDRSDDVLAGGVLTFDIEGAGFSAYEGFRGDANWADLRQVLISLQPIEGDRPACEVTARCPVAWAHTLNAAIGGVTTGLGALAGFAGGILLGTGTVAVLGPGAGVAAGLIAATSGGVGGWGGLIGLRRLYRYSLGRGEKAIEGMLSAVAIHAQGGWGVALRSPPAPPPP